MDLKFSESDVTFRQEVVDFLESEYPEDIKEKQDKRIPLEKEEIVRWQKILNQKGWFAINWPTEYTEQEELSVTQKYILQEELAKAGYEPTMGARPLKRVFEEKVKKPLSKKIIYEEAEHRDFCS